jgi:ABC-type dipeptide/oligopeptide/nickel transport system permease subunit
MTVVPTRRSVGASREYREPLSDRLRRAWKILNRNRLTLGGMAVLCVVAGVALAAPVLAPYNHIQVRVEDRLQPPSRAQWLGTDQFGRDVLSRLVMGGRASLVVGIGAMLVAAVAGISAGLAAGWFGGRADNVIMRIMDVILAFPSIILAIALAAAVGPGFGKLIGVIAIHRVPQFARLTRGAVLTVREYEFVQAARALGQRPTRIAWLHVLPNCLTPVIVYASFTVATAINTEAALSFLGLGIQPPEASWGTMLNDARQHMLLAPWLAVVPGLAITLTILGFNLVGDGVRDLMDPRLKGSTQ